MLLMAIIYANLESCVECPLSKAAYHYREGGYTSCEILCGFSEDRFAGYNFPPDNTPHVPLWCPLRAADVPDAVRDALESHAGKGEQL